MADSAVWHVTEEITEVRKRRLPIKEGDLLQLKVNVSVQNAIKGLWKHIKQVSTPHFVEPIP